MRTLVEKSDSNNVNVLILLFIQFSSTRERVKKAGVWICGHNIAQPVPHDLMVRQF